MYFETALVGPISSSRIGPFGNRSGTVSAINNEDSMAITVFLLLRRLSIHHLEQGVATGHLRGTLSVT